MATKKKKRLHSHPAGSPSAVAFERRHRLYPIASRTPFGRGLLRTTAGTQRIPLDAIDFDAQFRKVNSAAAKSGGGLTKLSELNHAGPQARPAG